MPARNEELVLAHQLDALARQTAEVGWELVVVDNGSSDRTAAIATSYADRIPGLRVIHEPTLGLYHARRAGVIAARADRLAFCDADDVVSDRWVASMADALDEYEVATGPLDLELLNEADLRDMRGHNEDKGLPTFYGLFPYARGNNFGVRRELFDRLGGFDAAYTGGEDIEFGMRAAWSNVEIGFAEGALVNYRYRTTPRQLWRQGFMYGRVRPKMRAALIEHGSAAPSPFAGWRSWLWLLRSLPQATTRAGRSNIAWVAGNRLGQLVGSWRARRVFV
ncbi:MAG TPA: glycosyltransferase [Ilumatobacter sp.]|nr:glycosyltransferase [Ilumatobacter sp.]